MTMDDGAPGSGATLNEAGSPGAAMARMGTNELLVLAGGGAAALANVLGVILSEWSLDLRAWVVILGGLAAVALSLGGAGRMVARMSSRTWIRIVAAAVGAFALVDLGDTLSSLGDWGILDIILTLIEVAAALVLAYGAWAAGKGSLVADTAAVARVRSLGLIDGLVYAGAVGVIAGWFLLMAVADIYTFTLLPQVAVLGATLILVARWLNRNPGAGKLPMAYGWVAVGLGAVVVVVALAWLINVIGRTFEFGDLTTFVPLILYVLAVVALGLGAFLSLGTVRMPAEPR